MCSVQIHERTYRYMCLCLGILLNEIREKRRSFNSKVDDRVHVHNSKLSKGELAEELQEEVLELEMLP